MVVRLARFLSEQQLEGVTGYLNVARPEGARRRRRPAMTEGPFAKGHLVAPTVYAECPRRHAHCAGRDLGPVMPFRFSGYKMSGKLSGYDRRSGIQRIEEYLNVKGV